MYLTLDINKASRDTENYLIINRIVTEHELDLAKGAGPVPYCDDNYSRCGYIMITEIMHVRYCDMTGQLEGMRVMAQQIGKLSSDKQIVTVIAFRL